MSVYNAVGEGPLSPPQEVFVGEAGECLAPGVQPGELRGSGLPLTPASPQKLLTSHPPCPSVPTAAPRNVVVHGTTATQLDVTWEPPPLDSQNGNIQGYKVWQRDWLGRGTGCGGGGGIPGSSSSQPGARPGSVRLVHTNMVQSK